jgi:hypothetical protein
MKFALRLTAAGICSFGSFILACLLSLNYYYNCSHADCASVHAALAPFYAFDFEYVFPATRMIHFPYIVVLFVECVYLYFIAIGSFVIFRMTQVHAWSSILDGLGFGFLILVVFETGIYFIDPGWWGVHVTNFIFYPLSLLTNESLFAISFVCFIIIIANKWLLHTPNPKC